ncbi:hypothetical protein [Maridesulfovibrio sp.]|uniref:hypothetical protein n=1 Tax=Maridesulfovibrio sp. TaxID=2795000 RepID=UPI003BAAF6A0
MIYPLINPYPLKDCHSDFEKKQAEQGIRKLRPLQAADTPHDIAELVELNPYNNLSSVLNDKLEESTAYQEAKKIAPPPKNAPQITKYQKDHKKVNLTAVDKEIHHLGHQLAEGQHIFHGGIWPPDNGIPTIGSHIILDRPLSTSFHPSVASNHSAKHSKKITEKCYQYDEMTQGDFKENNDQLGQESIWIIQTKAPIPAIIYGDHSEPKQEKEALIASGYKLTCKDVKKVGDILLISVDME